MTARVLWLMSLNYILMHMCIIHINEMYSLLDVMVKMFAEQISVGNTVLPMCCLLEVVLREERMRQPWLVKTLAGGKCQYLKSPKFPS